MDIANGKEKCNVALVDGEMAAGNQVGEIIPLTSDSDEVTARHITDHKHLFLNGHHFVTFSVAGDSDLYIFKVDHNLGGMLFIDGKFYMFTGDKYGNNANLIQTIWNHDWTPAISSPNPDKPEPNKKRHFVSGFYESSGSKSNDLNPDDSANPDTTINFCFFAQI